MFHSETAKLVGAPVSDAPWVEASVSDLGDGKTEILLHAKREYMVPGRNRATLLVNTNDPYQPAFSVFASADGIAAVRAVPAVMFLRKGGQQTASLLTEQGRAVRIVSASADKSGIVATIADDKHSLHIRVEGPVDSGFAMVRAIDESGNSAIVQVRIIQ